MILETSMSRRLAALWLASVALLAWILGPDRETLARGVHPVTQK